MTKMTARKRAKERTEALENVRLQAQRPAKLTARKRARERSASSPPKLKNYLIHYRKGKYYILNLDLKKKGRQQIP
jgi:hypothetical protein